MRPVVLIGLNDGHLEVGVVGVPGPDVGDEPLVPGSTTQDDIKDEANVELASHLDPIPLDPARHT